jgi:hypothetical protein
MSQPTRRSPEASRNTAEFDAMGRGEPLGSAAPFLQDASCMWSLSVELRSWRVSGVLPSLLRAC